MHTSTGTYAAEAEIKTADRRAPVEPEGEAAGSDPDVAGIWQEAGDYIRERISDGHFTAWFGKANPVAIQADTFLLALPNSFTHDWVEQRYLDVLADSLGRAAGRPLDVLLEVTPEAVSPEPPPAAEEAPAASPPAREREPFTPDFHPKYTFDSFVTGSSNQFARAAALAVSEAPARAYNPLFIYGGSGLGKTHLLHAIGHYVNECHPERVVRYVSTERFVNEFISALQRGTINDFHRLYRVADVLLVDDIQFLEGKERTQEEFFHTFNELHPQSQIVITSDRPPKKISTLEERLRTRFEWGLLADVQPPDLETRLAILNKKAESDGLLLPPEVMEFIAGRIQTNIRELEGALIRVAAYASLTRAPVTLDLAQEVLQSLLPGGSEAPVTADLIISVTADYFDVTPDDLKTGNRSRPLVTARQMAMYLCRELTELSFPQIGRRFGGKDHSTVHYAVEKINKQLPERQTCYQQVQELTARIRQQASRG